MPSGRRFKDKYAGIKPERICCPNSVRLVDVTEIDVTKIDVTKFDATKFDDTNFNDTKRPCLYNDM